MSDFMERYCTRNRMYFMRKNLPAWQAWLWYMAYRGYYMVDILIKKDTLKQYKFRVTSANEGWETLISKV
jgi:hypothetical protein